MILLVDADIVVFRAAFSAEDEVNVASNGAITIKMVRGKFENDMASVLERNDPQVKATNAPHCPAEI